MKHRTPTAERTTPLRLALREITGNVTLTGSDAYVWYVLAPQQWAFRSDMQRLNLLLEAGNRYAALAGHRLHLRVTTRPYPAAAWARGLDLNTPAPLPGWSDYLVDAQQHLYATTMAEKEVYLGVRVAGRRTLDVLAERVTRKATRSEVQRVADEASRITELVSGAGLDGRPATAREVEWLLRRSVGLGLPAPGVLSPATGGTWETDDLFAFTDGVHYEAPRHFARTTRVVGVTDSGSHVERYVAVLSVGRMDDVEVPDGTRDPWLAHLDRLPFPVEVSSRVDTLTGVEAKRAIEKKLLVVRDMQRHYAEHGLDEPLALDRQARQARHAEDEMVNGADVLSARVYGWHRIAVSAPTEEECLARARQVIDTYRSRRIEIAHPTGPQSGGSQYALLREFIPGEPVGTTAYRRRLPVLYFTAGLPTAAANVGDRRGPYIGYTCGSSRRAVMFDPHFATEVRETSGLVPIVGGLGAGKSVLVGAITYAAVRRGIPSVVLDPSGPLARLCTLPELRGQSRHIDLTTSDDGTLNPYYVVADPKRDQYADPAEFETAKAEAAAARKALALDIARMLLPPALDAQPDTRIVLSDAVRAVGGKSTASLRLVVEQLRAHDNPHGRIVANYLDDMAEMPLSRLFFPSAGVRRDHLDATLTVLTMPGLVLPPKDVPREHWSTAEQLSVPLLHLAAYYATRAIYGRAMPERKVIALDEIAQLSEWAAGRALFTRLARDSRKWNVAVLAASQNPGDVLGMGEIANFVSTAFVGRIEDEQVAADALRLLRVPVGVGYERVLATLSPRAADGRSGLRDFVVRDVDGRVDKVRIDLNHLPGVLAALDTTARPVDDIPLDLTSSVLA